MQANKQEVHTGSTENTEARIDHHPSPNPVRDATRFRAAGMQPLPPLPARWLPHRKAEVVAAVRNGFLSLDKARERYALSIEEYLAWERAIDNFGLPGLRLNAPQQRRFKAGASRDQSA